MRTQLTAALALTLAVGAIACQGDPNDPMTWAKQLKDLRNQKDFNPEWSRRGRGFPAYAAIRALGRSGIGEIVERCCAHAERLVREIGRLPGADVVASPVINQGLVRFLGSDGNHDRATDPVLHFEFSRRCVHLHARHPQECASVWIYRRRFHR